MGAFLGLWGQYVSQTYQRIGLYILMLALIAVSSFWGGYEFGVRQGATVTPQPSEAPTQTSSIANTNVPRESSKVSCLVNGREQLSDVIVCNSGMLSVLFKLEGTTEHPTWGKVFNGLVSEINLGTGVTAIDRIERWEPPGDWGTLEIAGWLTLQGLNDMTKERPMFDEVSNSNILIIPDNLSQQLQFEFIPEDAGFMVATICEYANPCRGHIVEFIYMP